MEESKIEDSIDGQISKEEQRNIYLSEMVKNLEQQLNKAKMPGSQPPAIMPAELQLAQIKNINKRIQIYRQELDKISQLHTGSVLNDIQALKTIVARKENEVTELTDDLNDLSFSINALRRESHGKWKNREIKEMYGDQNYQVEILKKKLETLEKVEEGQLKTLPRKSHRSFSQNIKVDQGDKPDKKSKIDEYALYKNLIKFYGLEQEKLKEEIKGLENEQQLKEKECKNKKEEIDDYQQKIEGLKKPKVKETS